ncbi:MAG: D-alanyl-D-alanine carboxypeptidase family protein [Ruminococcaceae bacterium]|nr:D-alanyl-D-alanine carboxypeptidase family protein [Oscillospiraceae bacterium]
MAKDRRHEKPLTKQQLALRISAVAIPLILLTVLIVVLVLPKEKPLDGPFIPPVSGGTTTTVSDATTTIPSVTTTTSTTEITTTTVEETTTTEEETTTTEEETTTTEEETTTTAAPPQNYDDGDWNMVLVNPWNPYPEESVRAEADNLVQVGYAEEYVDYRIIDSLNAMLEAGSAYGLAVTSSYRSYDDQEYFYNNKVDRVMNEGYSYEEALDIAATVVARPGTSEHHTGLAVDLVHNECWELEEYWEDSEAFDWLMEHCADYGFILRYPKESQDITGVIYEPWHYRYVGVEAAQAIMSQGITLEEYLG